MRPGGPSVPSGRAGRAATRFGAMRVRLLIRAVSMVELPASQFEFGGRMTDRVVINRSVSWAAPIWVARNVLAHAAMWLRAADHPAVEAFFADSDLNDACVDFAELPVEQFIMLHRGARIGLLCSAQK